MGGVDDIPSFIHRKVYVLFYMGNVKQKESRDLTSPFYTAKGILFTFKKTNCSLSHTFVRKRREVVIKWTSILVRSYSLIRSL